MPDPVYATHIKMTALGRIGDSGQERFAYGLSLAITGTPNDLAYLSFQPEGVVPTKLVDIAEDVRAFHGRAGSRIHSSAVLEAVKFATIGSDGLYRGNAIEVNVQDTPGYWNQNNSAEALCTTPSQSLCVSLGTGARQASKRGRFYPPMTVSPIQPNLLVPHQIAEDLRASVVELINNIHNDPEIFDPTSGSLQVIVASSKGYNTPVTDVRVGRVMDVVRSRRKQLQESYTTPAAVESVN